MHSKKNITPTKFPSSGQGRARGDRGKSDRRQCQSQNLMSESELVMIVLFLFIAFSSRKKVNSNSLTQNSSYTRLRPSKPPGKCYKNIQSKAVSKLA